LPEAGIGGDGGKLLAELGALLPRYVEFFVSFVVIGTCGSDTTACSA